MAAHDGPPSTSQTIGSKRSSSIVSGDGSSPCAPGEASVAIFAVHLGRVDPSERLGGASNGRLIERPSPRSRRAATSPTCRVPAKSVGRPAYRRHLFPRVVSRGRSAASSEPYSSSRRVRPRQAVGGRSDDRLRAITPLAMSWSSRSGAAPPQRRVGQGRQTDPMRRQPGRSKAVRSLSELFPHARRSRRRRCDKPTPASPATRVSNRTSIPSTRNENQPRPISRARLMKAGGSCASVMTTAAIPPRGSTQRDLEPCRESALRPPRRRQRATVRPRRGT